MLAPDGDLDRFVDGREGRDGEVERGPALFLVEIMSQELVVRAGKSRDFCLQLDIRACGSGPAENIGVRPGGPVIPVVAYRSDLGHHPGVVRLKRQRQIEAVDIGDIVIGQGDQLAQRNLTVGVLRDLRIAQVVVVANRPLRELVSDIVSGTIGDLGPIPHHDAVQDRVVTGLRVGDGALRVGIPILGIDGSARRQVCAIGSNGDAAAIPEHQRNGHLNALAGFQAEVVVSILLVADVATVFLVDRIVGIIQTLVSVRFRLESRVGNPQDRIDRVLGVVRDPQALSGDESLVRVLTIGHKLVG